MTDVRENWSNSCRESLATVKMNYQVFCKRWIGGIGVYGYICVSRALRVKRVCILSGARSRVFPFSLVLIHRVHPYRSSQVIDEVQRTTCVILRTQPSYSMHAAVSIYFQILFERLKVGSCASEVRAQLTVGLAPQQQGPQK